MDYFKKIEKIEEDLAWNIPEKKQGSVNIIGGNSQSFKNEVKVAEFLDKNYPVEKLNLVLPDALKGKLPELENFKFLSSTESGTFREASEISEILETGDFNLILGDLSKNSVTSKAISSAVEIAEKPLILTRDGVDLLSDNRAEAALMNENLILFVSVLQLQKLLRAIYYPKMLLLSQSLLKVAEVLHKFTLSYPVSVITLHNGQIIVAKNGEVRAIELSKSSYSPISFFNGEAAAKVVGLNLYNPGKFLEASLGVVG